MTDEQQESDDRPGLLGVLLSPLRAPQRVVSDIEAIASALLALQRDAHDRLASIDERAAALGGAVAALKPPLDRIDRKATELTKLEKVITVRMDGLREDLNTRLGSVEEEVRRMRAPLERISRDLATIIELLPDPSDGPLSRLKDTFSSS